MNKDILYPLRRLHGWMHQCLCDYRKNRQFFDSILSESANKVLLIGTPTHSNIGDSAIVLAELEFLRKCGVEASDIIEITFEELLRLNCSVRKALRKCAMVCWHGGGNMGSLWPHEEQLRRRGMKKLPANFPVFVFPQTLFYDASSNGKKEKRKSVSVYNGRKGLAIAAREKQSYQDMVALYPDTEIILTPDVVLSCDKRTFGVGEQIREGILLCLRGDKERILSDEGKLRIENYVKAMGVKWCYTDMYSERKISKAERMGVVREKMIEFASAELVITDRLHGMIFCALTGTPCVVLRNNNHKISGSYQWIEYLPYIEFIHTDQDLAVVDKMLKMSNYQYNPKPLEPYFEGMKKLLTSKMKL